MLDKHALQRSKDGGLCQLKKKIKKISIAKLQFLSNLVWVQI